MIGMLRGKVWEIQPDYLVIDVNGVGYQLIIPQGWLGKLRPGQEVTAYTYLIFKEDNTSLFGFQTLTEKQLFLNLLAVSGIGPKAAMAILSAYGVAQIQNAIVLEDVTMLTKVPGVGKKSAQRIILELKEKFKDRIPVDELDSIAEIQVMTHNDAIETMLALGFGLDEAKQALKVVLQEGQELSTEEQVSKALRYLGTKK